MKKGFSIVELSVVLVIIGLLIGGIIAGRSLIGSSNVIATVSQLQQFDSAVDSFKTKYKYLPGDAPVDGGDGDGMIERTAAVDGTDNQVNVFQCENATFWYYLFPNVYSLANVPACPAYGAVPTLDGPSKNVPRAKLGGPDAYFLASAIMLAGADYSADTITPKNYYAILSVSGNYYVPFHQAAAGQSAVKPADLLALDKKIDDGVANTGNVLSGRIGENSSSNGGIASGLNVAPSATCSVGATYQAQNNTYDCLPLIRMGSQYGDLQ